MIKKLTAAAAAASLALALTACGSSDSGEEAAASCETKTEVTMLGTIKVEIQDQFLAAAEDYNASQDCYTIVSVANDADSFLGGVTPMYAAGEAPVIMTALQDLPDMADKVMDWTGTELAGLAAAGTLEAANIDGKQVGIPVTAEAFGLLYNKAVLEEAGVDPAAIKTRDDLKAAFDAVEATGRSAIHFSGLWWSLGAHLTNIYHTTVSSDREARFQVFDGLADGTYDLTADAQWNNWLDAFDLMKEYDINGGKSIADDEYDSAVLDLAEGNVGFWFMGNWAEPNLLQTTPDGSFGVMPLPISNEAGAYGNDSISVGVPFYFMIDEEQSTEAERAGAIDFLTWLITTPEGQMHYAGPIEEDNMSFIPVYSGFTVSPATYMANEIATYIAAGKTLEWMNSYYPAEPGQLAYGASGQKYITGKIDREGFAASYQADWKGSTKSWR